MIKDHKNTVFGEILQWSQNRPDWQRHALRQIILNQHINTEELLQLCYKKHGIENISGVDFQPLESKHLPISTASTTNVSLVSLRQLKNVNRLSPNGALHFGKAPGLTIIYGDNGAGKSGYARVIKKACRARGQADQIQPDAYKKEVSGKASAHFVIQTTENGVTSEHPIDWQDGQESDIRLGKIFLFDSSCAEHYLSQDDGTAFVPFGLDILQNLATLCGKVADNIKTRCNKIEQEIQHIRGTWKYKPHTTVGNLMGSLNANINRDSIEIASIWTDNEINRLSQLRSLLSENPLIKAKKTELEANSIRDFRKMLINIRKKYGNSSIKKFKILLGELEELNKTAKVFAETKFDDSFLSGTGTKTWETLWNAAREYSIKYAYQGKVFPVTDNDAHCVLCQSVLSDIGKSNLEKFNNFMHDEINKLVAQKTSELEKIQGGLKIPIASGQKIESVLAGLTEQDQLTINTLITAISERQNAINNTLSALDYNNIPALPDFHRYYILSQLEKKLRKQVEIVKTADNPNKRELLEDELSELEDRQWLANRKNEVLEQIQRYIAIDKLQKCITDTNATAITKKNKNLTKKYVTEAFCAKFNEEIEELGLRTLSVFLDTEVGSKGVTKFKLKLKDANPVKVGKIASEGEKRSIALAFFLAELSQASHSSTLVFDDPVSSLDHLHKENTAKRLIKESQFRQVIVFTHDTSLLYELQMTAEEMKAAPHSLYLEWNNGTPGYCVNGLPWISQTASNRLNSLETDLNRIIKNWNLIPNESNKKDMEEMYSRLRATLERIVECNIFGDVLLRFRREIKFGRLQEAVGFSQEEYIELARLHKQCSEVTEAHNKSQNQNPRTRTPVELKSDIDATKALLEMIANRKKIQKKNQGK